MFTAIQNLQSGPQQYQIFCNDDFIQHVKITGGGILLIDTLSHRVVRAEDFSGMVQMTCSNKDIAGYVIWRDKIVLCPQALNTLLYRGQGFQDDWRGHNLDSLYTISALLVHEMAHLVSSVTTFQGRTGIF